MAFAGGKGFSDFEAYAPRAELDPMENLSLKYERMVGSAVLKEGSPRVPSLFEYANSVGEVDLAEDMGEDCHKGTRTPEFWCPLSVGMFEKYGHKMPAELYEQFLKEAAVLSELRLTEEDLPPSLKDNDPPAIRQKYERTNQFDILVDKIWEEVVDVWLGGNEDVAVTEEWEEQINEEAKEVWGKKKLGKLTLSSLSKAREEYLNKGSLAGCKVWLGSEVDHGKCVEAIDFLKAASLRILLDLHTELVGLASKHVPKNLKSQRLSLILAVCKRFLATRKSASAFSHVAYVNWAQREQLVLEEAYQLGKAQRPERECYVCKKMLPKTKFFRSQWLSNNASLRICVDCHENEWTTDLPGPSKDTKHDKPAVREPEQKKNTTEQGNRNAKVAAAKAKEAEPKPAVKMSKKEKRKAKQAAAAEERKKEEAREQRHAEAMEAARKLKEATEEVTRREKLRRDQLRKEQEKEKQTKRDVKLKAENGKKKPPAPEQVAKTESESVAVSKAKIENVTTAVGQEEDKEHDRVLRLRKIGVEGEKPKGPNRVCRHWKMKKKCWRSDQCGFLHPGHSEKGEEDGKEWSRSSQEPVVEQQSLKSAKPPPTAHVQPTASKTTESVSHSRPICPSWRAQGCCNFGKGCRFLHERDHRDSGASQDSISSGHSIVGGSSSGVCQLWRQGICTRGGLCGFLHPQSATQLANGGGAKSDDRDCFAFRTTGRCAFGDNCKFQHTDPTIASSSAADVVETEVILVPIVPVSAEVNVKGWSEHKLPVTVSSSSSLSSFPPSVAAAPASSSVAAKSTLGTMPSRSGSPAPEAAKSIPQDWACIRCTLLNSGHASRCDACLHPREEGSQSSQAASASSTPPTAAARPEAKPQDQMRGKSLQQSWDSSVPRSQPIKRKVVVQQMQKNVVQPRAQLTAQPSANQFIQPRPIGASSQAIRPPTFVQTPAALPLTDFLSDPQLLHFLQENQRPAQSGWEHGDSTVGQQFSNGLHSDLEGQRNHADLEGQSNPSHSSLPQQPSSLFSFQRSVFYSGSSVSSLWDEPTSSLEGQPFPPASTIRTAVGGPVGSSGVVSLFNSESRHNGNGLINSFDRFSSAIPTLTPEQDEPQATYHLPSSIRVEGSPGPSKPYLEDDVYPEGHMGGQNHNFVVAAGGLSGLFPTPVQPAPDGESSGAPVGTVQPEKKTGRCNFCQIELERKRLKKCGLCKAVRYCSPDCQHGDWSRHRESCVSLSNK
eukprot:gb/GEZN01000493.1/.p1 GENE.gb/GEZN01000493.1/~~gb/GEZN01000493.1/.p1  ORF type:complete len:1396 (-),score=222.76 gb/GEZN01000493.1/:112-3795(-)